MTRRAFAGLALVLALAAPSGCDKLFTPARGPFQGIDVTGGSLGGEVRLTDHNGRAVSLADFRGKVVVMAFGFTHCPDVCPTTLYNLAAARKALGEQANEVQVLFVTVDPKRDTRELLAQYVPAFDPTFLGLRGDEAALDRVKKDFHVYATAREGKTPETYTVDHSAQMFAFDRRGALRLVFPQDLAPTAIASDLQVLLNS